MFEKETARLGYLVAFFPANLVLFNNIIDVSYDVFTSYSAHLHIVIMDKKKAHLLHIITNSTWRIMFGGKHAGQLLQCILGL